MTGLGRVNTAQQRQIQILDRNIVLISANIIDGASVDVHLSINPPENHNER
jgi:hypothetical protein